MLQRRLALGGAAERFQISQTDELQLSQGRRPSFGDPDILPRKSRAAEIDPVDRRKRARPHLATPSTGATSSSSSADRMKRANHPPRASSSATLPLSITRPSSST